MKERPILFSAPMVRAVLAGRKTQTRRAVRPQPDQVMCGHVHWGGATWAADPTGSRLLPLEALAARCPYGKSGDRLWVREAWRALDLYDGTPPCEIAKLSPWRTEADLAWHARGTNARAYPGRLRPGIHMMRWACRLVLEVEDVRVERLHAMTGNDAVAEGVNSAHAFRDLWDSINGADAWSHNPWVWALTFRRITP